jgi:glutamyl-tRNA synthetase
LGQIDDVKRAQLKKAMSGLKERAKTLVELKNGAAFLFATRPLAMDDKAKQIMADGGREALQDLQAVLNDCTEWTALATETAVKALAESKAMKLGKFAR